MTKTVHPAFPHPLTSCRRKRSPKTMKRSQKKMIQAKKTNIDHSRSPKS